MQNAMSKWMMALVLGLGAITAQAQDWVAGTHYRVIANPMPTADADKVEVVEAFGYWCPHCNSFEPMLASWTKTLPDDVTFEHMPVIFSRSHELMARAYYVAELLGIKEQVHQAIYDAIHLQRVRFRDAEQIADLFANYGADRDKVLKEMNGFSVGMKLKMGSSRTKGYEVQGVPSLIVNGKYIVSAGEAGSNTNMMKVVEYLIDKERSAN
ncbi:MAG TPA: thiol:disulfide interchange protein DsbA/DsbL [Marinobacterium sp.]|nr:thiol:disulfide interchange protein DsbA/DsbL [Marinobacterium sp.]